MKNLDSVKITYHDFILSMMGGGCHGTVIHELKTKKSFLIDSLAMKYIIIKTKLAISFSRIRI